MPRSAPTPVMSAGLVIVGESDAAVAEASAAVAKLGQSEVEHLHVAGLL